jgi:glycerophosphoryl diester phosphodiesterase
LLLFSLALVAACLPDAPSKNYVHNISRPPVIAHQGGDGLWPGETLYAFERAVDIGAEVLEMDAHITEDAQIVLMHDEEVDRTTDGTGLIEQMTLAELKQLDAAYDWLNDYDKTFPYRGQGIEVPTLDELFQKLPQVPYLIEIKLTQHPIDKPLCNRIRTYNMQNSVMIASFHDETMQNFRATCPEIATSASRGEVTRFVLLGKAFLSGLIAPPYHSIQPPYDPEESMNIPIMTARFIREAHARNIKAGPCTVDDPDLMRQYIEWDVDEIITDRPGLMIKVLEEMGIC